MWDIKLKAMKEQTSQTKTHRHRQQCSGFQRERGLWVAKGKGGQIYGMKMICLWGVGTQCNNR